VCIEQELEALRESAAELESRRATADEWRRIEARAYLALLGGQLELRCRQRDMIARIRAKDAAWSWRRTHVEVGRIIDTLAQLRTLRTWAQSHVFDLEAAGTQRALST
jgi:hypothetical protein